MHIIMKKILKYIPVLVIITLITGGKMLLAQNNQQQNGEENLTAVEEMIKQVKEKKKEFTQQNMYLEIYETVNLEPQKTSIKKASKKFKMTDEQMQKMLKAGDITPLLERQKDLTLEKANDQYMEIYSTYQREMDMETMRTDLEQDTKPSEIFADGDTSNSDFDLIYDLSVIEEILFKKTSKIDFGGKFPETNIEFVSEEEKETIEELFETPADKEQGVGEEEHEAQTQKQGEEAETQKGVDPLSCFEDDSKLKDALDSFEEESAEGDAGRDDAEESADGDGIDEDGNLQKLGDAEVPSAVGDSWPKKYLCPDGAFFCIDLSFDFGPSESYSKTDNCIACHVQKINEAFDKMLEKPLSPNKISGNIFEVPKCKSAFTNLPVNMKIVSVAVPAPRQKNEDMYHQTNIDKEWQKIKELFGYFSYEKTESAEKADLEKAEPSAEDRATRKAISNAPPSATLADVTQRSSNIVSTQQKEKNEDADKKSQKTSSENQNRYFQIIFDELNTMKMYFNTMKDTYEKMKTPCNDLATKQNCT